MLFSRWDPSVLHSKGQTLRVSRRWEAQGQAPHAQTTEEEVRHVGARGHALHSASAPSLCATDSLNHEKVEKRKKKAVLAHHQHFKPGLSTVGARPPAVLQPDFRPDCPDRAASPGSPGPTCRSFLASLAPLVQATVRSELPALPSLAGPSTRGEQSWGTHPLSTVTWRQASPHTWRGLCSSIARRSRSDAKRSTAWNWPDHLD